MTAKAARTIAYFAMTTTDAAKILGITPHTLRQQIAKGKLQAVRHGRDWWLEPAEVERYKAQHRRVKA